MSVEAGGDGPVRRRVVVHGRVQGVWFRASTQTEAQRSGVAASVASTDTSVGTDTNVGGGSSTSFCVVCGRNGCSRELCIM